MEKAINKPWRMLYWEQRVALPIREQLRANYRYVDIGFDIDQRFGSAAGIENLRKWVRSQRTQEAERVEAERHRAPGSPQGRTLSEVQKLRARVFAEIIAVDKDAADQEADGEADGSSPAGLASPAGTAVQGRDTHLEPLATLFAPPSRNGSGGGGGVSTAMHGGASAAMHGSGSVSAGCVEVGGGAPVVAAAATSAASAVASGASTAVAAGITAAAGPGSAAGATVDARSESPLHQLYVSNNGKGPVLLPRPPTTAADAHRSSPTAHVNAGHVDVGGGGSDAAYPYSTRAATGAESRAAGAAAAGGGGAGISTPKRRSASELTPEDFRLGDFSSSKSNKKQKTDHSEVVSKVVAQVNNLNLPLGALDLLVETLLSKISAARASASLLPGTGGQVGFGSVGGLSLEERQLVLEEKVQAGKEAESAQALAERRLSLMEDMQSAGNQVITEEVIQKQRLVVLGLEPPLRPRHGGV